MSFFAHNFSAELDDPSLLSLRSGTNYEVEGNADKILAKGREGVTALSDKRDYLTNDQLRLRWDKEVFNINGYSDEALMSGMFRRTFNPMFGQRPTRHRDDG